MLEKKFSPKILVLSVSSWNSKMGADTWPSLVNQFNPENVASISLRENRPDSPSCNHYFIISENRVIRSVLNPNISTGYVVSEIDNEQHDIDLKAHQNRYQKKSRHQLYYLKLMIRELLWLLGRWKSKELDEFVDGFKPDVILYSMDGYPHFNRLCSYIKKRTNAKSIGFFVDDNFTFKQNDKFGFKLFRVIQRFSLKNLAKVTDKFWAISPLTKKEADKTFNANCKIVTKPARDVLVRDSVCNNFPLKILYAGNLSIGRDTSLVKLVNALKHINNSGMYFIIDIYTQTKLSNDTLLKLKEPFCHIHEPIPQHDVFKLQIESDILLFLEDIDGPFSQIARLSFSTKITDYLSTGKGIIAIGNLNTAPIQYFLDNKCALVATSDSSIIEILNQIKENPGILLHYGNKAKECAIKYHSKQVILSIVKEDIKSLLNLENTKNVN